MSLIDGYNFYKEVQGTKYDKNDKKTKNKLKQFRDDLGLFTDSIFLKNGLQAATNGKGMWQNSGNFTSYMWNRYKFDDESNLVIYFNASTVKKEGMFVSIGLIDDKLSELEKEQSSEIYKFLEKACKNIKCDGFKNNSVDWSSGERVFKIENEEDYIHADYDCLLSKLQDIYKSTYELFYKNKDPKVKKNENSKINDKSLNQILYGPPGTGKTYNTINKSLEILGIDISNKTRTELTSEFKKYKENGQIEFVTFHQSYGYEEFVEGIKAKTTDASIEYKVEPGIFNTLVMKATKNIEQAQINKTIKKDFDVIFKERILDTLSEDERLEITMKKSSFYIKEVDNTHIYFDKSGGESQHVLLIKNLKKMYEVGENTIIMGGLSQYYNPLLEFLLKDNEIKNEDKEPLKNYILIIDEINRGNISKIFGELITLIEPSKRIGADEELYVKLPYSNKDFGVPKNLHIIGTMNTADRSIAPIDTALRRRFIFEEMSPDAALLTKEKTQDIYTDVDLKQLLEAINTRIEYLYDKDHTIGHAYLLDVKNLDDLKFAFKNKIIPLLAEYFYEDWENIKLVLNDKQNKFIDIQEKENHPALEFMDKNYNKKLYSINKIDELVEQDFINIYPKIEDQKSEIKESDEPQ